MRLLLIENKTRLILTASTKEDIERLSELFRTEEADSCILDDNEQIKSFWSKRILEYSF
jgi:hypothetical protein